jgi:sigma-E factor negative regulatory protein RseC
MIKDYKIEHAGIVQEIDESSVIIKISPKSACSGCHAEGYCNVSGNEDKTINIYGSYDIKPGDHVAVLMKQSLGYAALLLGYLAPLFAVMLILILLISFSVAELTAGLLSLAVLIPYYFILFIFRKRLSRKFTFSIKT